MSATTYITIMVCAALLGLFIGIGGGGGNGPRFTG